MLNHIIELLNLLFQGFKFSQEKEEKKYEAISSLRQAIRVTKRHINNNRIGEFGESGFSDNSSKALSIAWKNAAAHIRPFDKDLAQTLEDKSDYWLDPMQFWNDIIDEKRRFNYRFRLSEVEKKLKSIESSI